MKYWNKQKVTRNAEWTTSPPPATYLIPEAKRWCQQWPSNYRFYFHYTNTRWWFENEGDAIMFALVWGNVR